MGSFTRYGMTIDKGVGVFNGDMGIVKEINSYEETVTVEYDEQRMVNIRIICWKNWNWLMRLPYINHRGVNILQL